MRVGVKSVVCIEALRVLLGIRRLIDGQLGEGHLWMGGGVVFRVVLWLGCGGIYPRLGPMRRISSSSTETGLRLGEWCTLSRVVLLICHKPRLVILLVVDELVQGQISWVDVVRGTRESIAARIV